MRPNEPYDSEPWDWTNVITWAIVALIVLGFAYVAYIRPLIALFS